MSEKSQKKGKGIMTVKEAGSKGGKVSGGDHRGMGDGKNDTISSQRTKEIASMGGKAKAEKEKRKDKKG